MAETTAKTVTVQAPNKGFTGVRLAQNGDIVVYFHKGKSAPLPKADADAFLKEYPKYSIQK